MGSIKIIDTGYVKATNAGTQATSGNMANSGAVITLKVAEFTPALKRNFSATPEIGYNSSPSEVNLGSLENMTFNLQCVLNSKTSADMALIQHLLHLVRTNGYKLMWYDYTDASAENNNGQLIYQLALNSLFGHTFTAGEISKWTLSGAFSHLHIAFTDISPRHSGKSGLIVYTLTGVVLPVETSII